MQIALVTNLFPPIQTGTSHWVKELAHHLSLSGHHVIVITCSLNRNFSVENIDGCQVYRLPAYHLPVSKLALGFEQFYLGNLPGNGKLVEEILVQEQVNIVHQCGHLLDLDFLVPRVCNRLGIPSVCSIHTIVHFPRNQIIDWFMKLVDGTLVKSFSIRRYDRLIALDAEIEKYAHHRYHHPKIEIVYPCIDPDILDLPRAMVDAPETPFKILSIGHVTTMRHRLDLIKVIDQLNNQGFSIELTIVGKILDNAPVKLTKQLGLENVIHFVGELPRNEVLEIARDFHMEAHWITTPGLGTAILEAMALGLPVMTYAYPGIYGDVPLKDLENIIFATPGDITQISDQIVRLVDTPALRSSIGNRGRKLLQDYLTWPKVVKDLEAIYLNTIMN